jgi:Leucine-rich repeat (LRR) protein
MIEGIQLEDGEYGQRAVATSAWSDEMTDYMLGHGIKELELNEGKGWRGNDLSFLAKLPRLEALTIIDLKIASVAPIHFLPKLRALEVTTYCHTEIRFSTFSQLEECTLEWRPQATSLFDCPTLKRLFVNRYDGKDANPFTKLVGLESLAILNAPVENVRGLSALKNLQILRLANLKRLTSLAGIEQLVNLEQLEIHTCRAIGSIDEVGTLSRLRNLNLNNDGGIKSLKPLEELTCLESVVFYESTNILDGDLSPLLRGKHLSRISFQNRRHYSHRREEFGVAYTG